MGRPTDVAKVTKKNPKQHVNTPTRVSLSGYDFEGTEAGVIQRIQVAFEAARTELKYQHKLFQIPEDWELYLDEQGRSWEAGSDWVVKYRRLETDQEYDKRMVDVAEHNARTEAAQRKQYEELAKKFGK